jgi:hypothetical protein
MIYRGLHISTDNNSVNFNFGLFFTSVLIGPKGNYEGSTNKRKKLNKDKIRQLV